MKMKKSSNFKYFVSEGCKSYTSNGLMSLASTIIVVASLVVLGLYLLFSMNINYVAKQLEEECEIPPGTWANEMRARAVAHFGNPEQPIS